MFFEVNARQLEIDGAACVLATVRDRTAEHRAEMDRLLLQNQLQQASKMEAIGQLAGGIAHDFNNILASIIGYAELVQNARERLEPAQIDKYLSEVVTAGHRARDLISQMLTFTRANRGDPCSVDISEAITDVSRMLRAAIPTTIDIETEFADDLANVIADPVQLQQIIINLLINARDAIKGNGRIRIRAARGQQTSPCACCGEVWMKNILFSKLKTTAMAFHRTRCAQNFRDVFHDPGARQGYRYWSVADRQPGARIQRTHHSALNTGYRHYVCYSSADGRRVAAIEPAPIWSRWNVMAVLS